MNNNYITNYNRKIEYQKYWILKVKDTVRKRLYVHFKWGGEKFLWKKLEENEKERGEEGGNGRRSTTSRTCVQSYFAEYQWKMKNAEVNSTGFDFAPWLPDAVINWNFCSSRSKRNGLKRTREREWISSGYQFAGKKRTTRILLL